MREIIIYSSFFSSSEEFLPLSILLSLSIFMIASLCLITKFGLSLLALNRFWIIGCKLASCDNDLDLCTFLSVFALSKNTAFPGVALKYYTSIHLLEKFSKCSISSFNSDVIFTSLFLSCYSFNHLFFLVSLTSSRVTFGNKVDSTV